MSYGDHKLFLYDTSVDLVINSDGLYVDNRPMNNKKLIAHKGLSNEIIFNIRNPDRKLQNIDSDNIIFELSAPNRAGILIPDNSEEGEDILMLVMPVMLNS